MARPGPIKAGLPAAAKGGGVKADRGDKENNGGGQNARGGKAKGLGGGIGLQPRNANAANANKGLGGRPGGGGAKARGDNNNNNNNKPRGLAPSKAVQGAVNEERRKPKGASVSAPAAAAATAAEKAALAAAAPPPAPPTPPTALRERAQAALALLGLRYGDSAQPSTTEDTKAQATGGGGDSEASESTQTSPAAAPAKEEEQGEASASAAAPPVSARELRSQLLGRQLEVEYLLRPALSDAPALEAARADVNRALSFDDELAVLGAAHDMSKGRLFQALLEELRLAEAGHAQVDNSGKKASTTDYADEFGAERWAELAAEADNLRKIVRIKVADDNDLKTARAGLLICKEFFDGVAQLAKLQGGKDDFAVIEELSALSC